jgi:hypothetical protein
MLGAGGLNAGPLPPDPLTPGWEDPTLSAPGVAKVCVSSEGSTPGQDDHAGSGDEFGQHGRQPGNHETHEIHEKNRQDPATQIRKTREEPRKLAWMRIDREKKGICYLSASAPLREMPIKAPGACCRCEGNRLSQTGISPRSGGRDSAAPRGGVHALYAQGFDSHRHWQRAGH